MKIDETINLLINIGLAIFGIGMSIVWVMLPWTALWCFGHFVLHWF